MTSRSKREFGPSRAGGLYRRVPACTTHCHPRSNSGEDTGGPSQDARRRLREGTRLIPAAESGLLGSAETPVAIAMAWIILSETPPLASIIGAIIVLAAVLLHAGADFTSATPPSDQEQTTRHYLSSVSQASTAASKLDSLSPFTRVVPAQLVLGICAVPRG